MNNFNPAVQVYFGAHIAAYCDAIETTILATESDRSKVHGAQIALDALRRIVGAPIPNRGTTTITIIDQPALPAPRTTLKVESAFPDLHYRVR